MRWLCVALVAALPLSANAADPAQGRENFHKLRCDTCHSVYAEKQKAPVPLRDFSKEPPEAITRLIVQRTHLAPEMLFDEIAMSSVASFMTKEQLADIVAYLRNPSAAAEKGEKKNR